MQDREWIERALKGDRGAADALAERLACIPAFVRCINRRLGKPLPQEALKDVAQDAFAALWSKLDAYDGVRDLEGWAFGFCFWEMRSALRKQRRAGTLESEVEDTPPDGKTDGSGGAETAALEDLERVEEALRDLGPPGATIVTLKHFEEHSFPAIAERLDMPLGSVKTHYYRALEKLRPRLLSLWRAWQ